LGLIDAENPFPWSIAGQFRCATEILTDHKGLLDLVCPFLPVVFATCRHVGRARTKNERHPETENVRGNLWEWQAAAE